MEDTIENKINAMLSHFFFEAKGMSRRISKVKWSYGVHKFKHSNPKKFHISLYFVIVFASGDVKVFLATGFEFGKYAVTALCFS